MTRHLIAYVLILFVGMWIGLILERRGKRRLDEVARMGRADLRKMQYTGQHCEECRNGTVYPAVCDTCGASFKALMFNRQD